MTRILPSYCLVMLLTLQSSAQERVIHFPDVAPFQTLVADLHMHTVFSDGSVWPNIRVDEALRDGLDVIAVTDHLEYLPHRHDIPFPDRNRPHEIATASAGDRPLVVINGSEVTRRMPLGHLNAIFVQDANSLVLADSIAALQEANSQGAFIFWNHPNWVAQNPSGLAALNPVHLALLQEGLLHGIEIANEQTYSDEALAIALEHDLAILATSDIHGLVDWQFAVPEGGHRPVTLVFATGREKSAIREALRARRTVAYFKHRLIGRAETLEPLLAASLTVTNAAYGFGTTVVAVTISNASSTPFTLRNVSAYTLHEHTDLIVVPARGEVTIKVKTGERLSSLTLTFEALNALTAPGTHPRLPLAVDVP